MIEVDGFAPTELLFDCARSCGTSDKNAVMASRNERHGIVTILVRLLIGVEAPGHLTGPFIKPNPCAFSIEAKRQPFTPEHTQTSSFGLLAQAGCQVPRW